MNKMKIRDIKEIKINILRAIFIILLIGTFSIIFGFSSQDAGESKGISRRVTKIITNPIKSLQEKPEQEKEQILSRIESIVRKIAHFSIYTVVGFLLMALFSTYKLEEMNRFSYSLIIGVIYAISDEIHQCFTPGRGPQVTDVIIDTMGVLLGILLVMLVIKIYEKLIIKHKKQKDITKVEINN